MIICHFYIICIIDYFSRYQNDEWYLISMIGLSGNTHTGEEKTIDTKCLTGDQVITTMIKVERKRSLL